LPETAEWQVFENKELGFTFRYPAKVGGEEWGAEEIKDQAYVLFVGENSAIPDSRFQIPDSEHPEKVIVLKMMEDVSIPDRMLAIKTAAAVAYQEYTLTPGLLFENPALGEWKVNRFAVMLHPKAEGVSNRIYYAFIPRKNLLFEFSILTVEGSPESKALDGILSTFAWTPLS
jgi:hypothetical protein